MHIKMLALFLMVMFAVSVAQPIFALDPKNKETQITDQNGLPLKDITVHPGEKIKLQARLYCYVGHDTTPIEQIMWLPQIGRYLYFYVYNINADGTNGALVWGDVAITNFITANANPDKFKLTETGDYRLVVIYKGTLNHCNATVTIRVI